MTQLYHISLHWEINKLKYEYIVSGDTTLQDLYLKIMKRNGEWYEQKLLDYKFKKVWCVNLLTQEEANHAIQIKNLSVISTYKTIERKIVKQIPTISFKAIVI